MIFFLRGSVHKNGSVRRHAFSKIDVFHNVKWEEGTKEEFESNALMGKQQDVIYSQASKTEKQN